MTSDQTILQAAEQLFLEKGFALTSTADIARRAGCNTALIHYYYRTKANLFEGIFKQKILLFAQSFADITTESCTFEQKIRQRTASHFEFIRANSRLPFLLLNEITTNPDCILKFRSVIEQAATGILSTLQCEIDIEVARGRIRPITASELALNIGTLNVMTFLTLPVIVRISGVDSEAFLDQRKEEIINTIINSLKNNAHES